MKKTREKKREAASVRKPCPFCQRIFPVLAENVLAVSFFDRYPASPGHVLVIPKRHVETYFACTPAEKAALWEMVEEVSRLPGERKPDGFNVGFNVGRAAGQTVFHAHIHVIPRYEGDVPDPRGGVRHAVVGKGYY
jgi:diadenosine tetraphosphate (Ap4A) HIT family hydrolase